MTMARTVTVSTGNRALVSESADALSVPATGQADERYGMPLCPGWHNSVRWFRDVVGYSDVSALLAVTCDTCGGSGQVPYKGHEKRQAWARKYKACPAHVETVEELLDLSAVPALPALVA